MNYFSLVLIVYAAVMVCIAALVSLVPEAKPWAALAALVWPVALLAGPAVNLAAALARAFRSELVSGDPRPARPERPLSEVAELVAAARSWRARGLAPDRDPALAAVDLQLSESWLMLARQCAFDAGETLPEEFWIWTDAERRAHREKARRAGWDTYNATVLADDRLRASE